MNFAHFRCPDDKSKLNQVSDILKCQKCGKEYPIIEGVPCFILDKKEHKTFSSNTFALEWEYFSLEEFIRLGKNMPAGGSSENEAWINYDVEKGFRDNTGFKPEELNKKKILEVGTGSGRLLLPPLRYGATVFGIDYSDSVFIAYKQMKKLNIDDFDNRVILCKADLFKMPFEDNYFDFMFSIGVIHHTPDTKQAFCCLPRYLNKGGRLSIWVYPAYTTLVNKSLFLWRKAFHLIPARLFFYLCKALALFCLVYRVLPMLNFILPLPYKSLSFRDRVRSIWDYYNPKYLNKHTYYEVYQWYKEYGFDNFEVLKDPVSCSGRKI